MQVVYPITELCDSKGFRIDFSYERSGNCLYLTKIQYCSMSKDNHPAEMVFNYVERDDFTTCISLLSVKPNVAVLPLGYATVK